MLSKWRLILDKNTLKTVFEDLNPIYATLHLLEHKILIHSNDFIYYSKNPSG